MMALLVLLLLDTTNLVLADDTQDEDDGSIFNFIIGECFIENGIAGIVQCPLEAAGLFLGLGFFIILCGLGTTNN